VSPGYSRTESFDLSALDGDNAWMLTTVAITSTNRVSNLKRTTTGAGGFTLLNNTLPAVFKGIHFFTPLIGVAIAEVDAQLTWPMYRTTDGGLTWTLVGNVPMATSTYAASVGKYHHGNSLWIILDDTTLRTTDAGLTWANVPLQRQLAFEDEQNGLAYNSITGTQQLLRTADGGQTWTAVAGNGLPQLTCLTAVKGRPGTYIAGSYSIGVGSYNGITMITRDRGASWSNLSVDNHGYINLLAPSASKIWAIEGFWSGPASGSPMLLRYGGSALGTLRATSAAAPLAFPCPTTGVVALAGQVPAGALLRVYDLAGRLCLQVPATEAQRQVDLSALSAGAYQMVLSAPGGVSRRQQIIKQ